MVHFAQYCTLYQSKEKCHTATVFAVDSLLGVRGREANSENKKDLFQESNADGDRMVRLHLCGGTQHEDIRVSYLQGGLLSVHGMGECLTQGCVSVPLAVISTR